MTLYDEHNHVVGTIDAFTTINGHIREVVLLDGRKIRFAPGEIVRDDAYSYRICRSPYYSRPNYDYSRQSTEQAKKNDIVLFGMCRVSIRKVIFNDPATIVLWSDGSKTVVKCGPEDTYDMEKGLAMAIVKKMAGNDNSFHKVFKQYPKKKKKEPGSAAFTSEVMAKLSQASALMASSVHDLAAMAAAKAERGE